MDYIFFCTAVFVFICVLLIYLGEKSISGQQLDVNEKFKAVKDFYNCPLAAKYFGNIQNRFNVWQFCMCGSSVVALVTIFFLIVLRKVSTSSFSFANVLIISMYFFLATFITLYKFLNCVLYRICGQDTCAMSYFDQPNPEPPVSFR